MPAVAQKKTFTLRFELFNFQHVTPLLYQLNYQTNHLVLLVVISDHLTKLHILNTLHSSIVK